MQHSLNYQGARPDWQICSIHLPVGCTLTSDCLFVIFLGTFCQRFWHFLKHDSYFSFVKIWNNLLFLWATKFRAQVNLYVRWGNTFFISLWCRTLGLARSASAHTNIYLSRRKPLWKQSVLLKNTIQWPQALSVSPTSNTHKLKHSPQIPKMDT